MVQTLDESSFESVLKAQEPVLVDFWAEWCGPCKAFAPTLQAFAEEQSGKVVCCKLDIDQCPDIATHHNIRSVPSLLLFKEGKEVDRRIGAMTSQQLNTWVASHLS